jgi:pyrroline-5-carboxylate reductase
VDQVTTHRPIDELTVGLIGAGNMAEALIRGLLARGVIPAERLWVTNRVNTPRLEALRDRFAVQITREKYALAEAASTLILAVKPKDMAQALDELRGLVHAEHLVISVAAGIPLATIEGALPDAAVIRAMPNTSAAVQESATVLAAGSRADATHLHDAEVIFRAVGDVAVVDEELLDAVTALSGSGPAYVYHLIEAMIHAGSELGLDGDLARRLAVQTLVGAARMLTETSADPGELRRRVTSPGGTTMAALQTLEARGFARSVREAVDRAAQRSRELAGEFGGTGER